MASVVTVTDLALDASAEAAARSIASIERLVRSEPQGSAAQGLNMFAAQQGLPLLDAGDVFLAEPTDRSANGATVLESAEIKPSDAFLELVTALARELNADVAWVCHWPLLSLPADDRCEQPAESIA